MQLGLRASEAMKEILQSLEGSGSMVRALTKSHGIDRLISSTQARVMLSPLTVYGTWDSLFPSRGNTNSKRLELLLTVTPLFRYRHGLQSVFMN